MKKHLTNEQKQFITDFSKLYTARKLADMFNVRQQQINGYLKYHKLQIIREDKGFKMPDEVTELFEIGKYKPL